MTFSDIFKSGFLESAAEFSAVDMAMGLGASFLMGLFIFMVYKKTYSGVMYSSGFAVSLIGMSMITTMIILAISSNVVLSLGMVGALSIVRFRTAIKDPMDICYLFWAISEGIVVGAGMLPMALCGGIAIGLMILVFAGKKGTEKAYIVVLNCKDDAAEVQALSAIKANTKKYLLKSKTVNPSGIELSLEVRLKDNSTSFLNQLAALPGISNPCLVSYNGEYCA